MRLGIFINRVLLGALLLALPGPASSETPTAELARARQDLRIANDEWRQQEAAFRKARTEGRVKGTELDDFAAFVAGLRVRLLRQCEITRNLGGEAAVKGYDCIEIKAAGGRPVTEIATASPRTEEEKAGDAKARLDALEAEIDEALLKRQLEIRNNAANSSGSASTGMGAGGRGGDGGGGSSDTSADTGKGKGSQGKTASRGSRAEKTGTGGGGWSDPRSEAEREADKSVTSGGESNARGAGSGQGVPQSAPDGKKDGAAAKRADNADTGSDDDIVARQLREAAEKETDPVLKEKLWEEYRKYKRAQK